MKYLFSILSILTAITAVTLFFIWPEQHNVDSDAVVTVNGKTLTKQFFQNHRERDPHHADGENYVKTIVTKQLLLAEAQRRHIDQQPAFRLALKTLYENSLIELLIKDVNHEIETTVSTEEVANYLEAFGKIYTFYVLQTSHPVSIETIESEGTKYVSRFDELSSTLRQSLASMNPGIVTSTFAFNREKIAIYLEKVEGETTQRPDLDTKKIRNQLQQIKAEKQVNAWIEELRSQAVISYHINQE
jgi:hypothetical protein